MPKIGTSSRKEEIIKVSLELFSLYGYKATSVRKIAKQVGVRESALYNHFKNKDDIFLHVIQRLFNSPILSSSEDLSSDELADKKKNFFNKLVVEYKINSFDTKSEKLFRLIMIELFQNRSVRESFLKSYHQDTIKKLSEVLFIMMQKGYIRSADPILMANEFLAPLFYLRLHVTLLRLDSNDTTLLSTQFEKHVDFFWENISI